MKIHKLYISLALILTASAMLIGCKSKKEETIPSIESEPVVTEAPAPTPEATQAPTAAPEATPIAEESTTKSIIITIYNLSNVDIGMFSVIDPVTGEQINLSALAPGESVSLESNWPKDTKEFQWALYNSAGELCISAATDISEAETAAHIALSGDGNITDVETAFQ